MNQIKQLNVLHTESSLGWGGQENRTLNEMLTMREMGHHCQLACQPGAKLGIRAREAGFDVTEISMRGALDIPALWALRRLMTHKKIEIVNSHSSKDTLIAGLAARSLLNRPRIVRTRHLALPITSTVTYSGLPDHVVTVSAFVGEYLASAGVPRGKITAVPTGIDFARYQHSPDGGTLKAELGLSPETILVGTVAILRKKKGHAELLAAVPSILEKHPEARFVFAGDGAQTENLKTKIADMGLQDKVFMLGLRRDVINVLQSLDVFALPTHQEALGTAFIEASAMGLPCIGTNVDGVPEVVADGVTGLLVPPISSESIAKAILQLLDNPEQRRQMGQAASERVRKVFSRQAMAQGMVKVYERLLATHQGCC
jgi:glycosyltransferase involved in cell wall biosynthesis